MRKGLETPPRRSPRDVASAAGPDREISCRPHSGFAPNSLRQHLNTWCAHGHKLKLLSEVCLPQACWSVLSWKKKNLFGITEFLGKCQLSHPIVSGAGMHLTSEYTDSLQWPYFGERAVCGGPIVPRQLSMQVWACGRRRAAAPAPPCSPAATLGVLLINGQPACGAPRAALFPVA